MRMIYVLLLNIINLVACCIYWWLW